MKKNDLVMLKETKQTGIIKQIIKEDCFPDEYIVDINGEEFSCYMGELEVVDV